ncbi:carbohydrate-binding domain-containing protein [Feifania hominis]|uniref:Carbohydrate-binding domain-containing protein n=1 Tax=Feifania hominis TaxID=2763660 RepID=A0A926DFE4_9FIRM|nr:carbohydrate-binding domain-containing protein [Feifania hominis]MBC8536025.1 carbohydrate-binding domain-containing protein [Feifania hominis]
MKQTKRLLALAIALCLMLTACSGAPADGETTNAETQDTPVQTGVVPEASYDSDDLNDKWTEETCTVITLADGDSTVSGPGAAAQEGGVLISAGGTYVLRGTLSDGSVVIDAPDTALVRLVLDGVAIHCETSAALYSKKAAKTVIILAEGSENRLSDGTQYVYETEGDDEPNAALFAKDDLTINGLGSLHVEGNYNNGIVSRDDLRVVSGNVTVTAADDAVMGRDLVAVRGGELHLEAVDDAIKSTNDTDASKGSIVIDDGSFTLTCGGDGIQAERSILITGGDFTITAGGGSGNSAGDDEASAKGIKATDTLTIRGGSFVIDSYDDALHSNSSIAVEGGTLSLSTGDDGIHADSVLTVSGGDIAVTQSYEGMESAQISISGGSIAIVASDDGINVAGGNDATPASGRRSDRFQSGSSADRLTVSGGTVTVNAQGDGLDANGSIYITGGTVLVDGPTEGGDGAIDYDGVFEISGGTLVAVGSAQMAQSVSSGSTQPAVLIIAEEQQSAGTPVQLTDDEGNVLLCYVPVKSWQSAVVSLPALSSGETCRAYAGGSAGAVVTGGLCDGGDVAQAKLVGEAELTAASVTIGSAAGGFGRGPGAGGDRQPPDGQTTPGGENPPDGSTQPGGERPARGDAAGGQRPGRMPGDTEDPPQAQP